MLANDLLQMHNMINITMYTYNVHDVVYGRVSLGHLTWGNHRAHYLHSQGNTGQAHVPGTWATQDMTTEQNKVLFFFFSKIL